MIQSFDWTTIKKGIVRGGEFVSEGVRHVIARAGSLAGRVITIIKSGVETALPYLQNPWCGGAALFAFSVTNLLLASKVAEILEQAWSVKTEPQAVFKSGVKVLLGFAVWGGGLTAFISYTHLRLPPLAMAVAVAGSAAALGGIPFFKLLYLKSV